MFLKLLVTIGKYTCNVLTLLSMAKIPTKEFGFAFISMSTVLPAQERLFIKVILKIVRPQELKFKKDN